MVLGNGKSVEASLSQPAHDFLARPKRLLIGGEWLEAINERTFQTLDPATGAVIAECSSAGPEDVNRAVSAARTALDNSWSKVSPSERGRLLWKLSDLIERNREALAEVESLDVGKPIRLSRDDDLPMAIDQLRYFAGWATKIEGTTIPVSAGSYLNYTLREPLGVVGQIIPWNYPLMLAIWKLAPALATGNTCILKPAEQTPLTALWLGELIQEAGFPDGVVNILTGYGETAGAPLVEHPGVDGIAFTGSVEVGRLIMRSAVGTLKRIQLELGGKSPNIIFADADLDRAIDGAAFGIFYNSGQDCAAASRLFVEKRVYEEFMAGMAEKAKGLKVGNPFEAGIDEGPLVSEEQLNRVSQYVDSAKRDGAEVLSGGDRISITNRESGFFFAPTVLTRLSDTHLAARDEIFGPVVVAFPFQDIDEVVSRANATKYGLGAGVWTRDVKKAHRTAAALKAGSVWINCYNVYDSASPFGGYKGSGFGKDLGRATLDTYTQIKSVWVNLGD
jgi:acyl-CoA reductase-like NAD-dependent aldehyde dehydrogenase